MSVIELLDRLISYPSISSMPVRPLAAELAQRCEDLGFQVEEHPTAEDSDKINLVCTAGPSRPGGLVLSGHMDVVPVDGQPWSSDPFKLVERDGRLFGRGTTDMKGFIAACLQALEDHDPGDFTAPLVLVWTCDEEVGCLGSAALARELSRSTLPTATWIGEPTDFRLLRMHAGHVAVHV
ncbi:MAG: M20/M25/M40 family metallo-hydrolase, partial [Myxococcota bacterium]|nr:M20/M25/M40 family metallo-hydrolase [Myxococcota bacterium]